MIDTSAETPARASFSPDRTKFVTTTPTGKLRLFDTGSGRPLLELGGHKTKALDAAFSPDGKRLLTGSADVTAKVWELEHGTLLATLEGVRSPVTAVAWSPEGKRIVTGHCGGHCVQPRWSPHGDRRPGG